MLSPLHQRHLLSYFFLAIWLLLLWITKDTLHFSAALQHGSHALAFILIAWLSYCVIYLLPALALSFLAYRLAHLRWLKNVRLQNSIVYGVAILAASVTLLFFYADAKLYALYGIFVNGFVINLISTPGGIESLGGSDATNFSFSLITLGFVLGTAALLALIHAAYHATLNRQWMPRRIFSYLMLLFVVCAIGERGAYAYADVSDDAGVLSLSENIPFYMPFTARKFFRKAGFEVPRRQNLQVSSGHLRYPLNPLSIQPPAKPYNIVWLASESLRADMLTPEIMPRTWAFAQRAQRFTRNYSGGNGTRVGVFTMFTGIPGPYWFSFLNDHRGAAIIDVLKAQNYQMSLYTSAAFTYPEFDKTIFKNVSADKLHSLESGTNWEKDRINVGNMLDFIDRRDTDHPFFSFMFFESPHARYYFPPESVIRRPYLEDINYATLNKDTLARNIVPIKNRYINAVHHLDSQFGRIFDYLEQHGLLDNTIVILLGDHGEAFLERGYWGHNSDFSDQQTRTPLVIWKPGTAPHVSDALTSHMDIVPTLMPLLGVKNPAGDYSTGIDLFSGQQRKFTYLADWARVAYVDNDVKIIMPTTLRGMSQRRITTQDDEPVPDARNREIFAAKQQEIVRMMQDLGKFTAKKD